MEVGIVGTDVTLFILTEVEVDNGVGVDGGTGVVSGEVVGGLAVVENGEPTGGKYGL